MKTYTEIKDARTRLQSAKDDLQKAKNAFGNAKFKLESKLLWRIHLPIRFLLFILGGCFLWWYVPKYIPEALIREVSSDIELVIVLAIAFTLIIATAIWCTVGLLLVFSSKVKYKVYAFFAPSATGKLRKIAKESDYSHPVLASLWAVQKEKSAEVTSLTEQLAEMETDLKNRAVRFILTCEDQSVRAYLSEHPGIHEYLERFNKRQ